MSSNERIYECVFISRQDLTSKDVESATKTFLSMIKDHGGEVLKIEQWGLLKLSYQIRKNKRGYFTLLNFTIPLAGLKEFERQLKLNENVLRYIVLRVDAVDPEPSPILASARQGEMSASA